MPNSYPASRRAASVLGDIKMKLVLKLTASEALALRRAWENSAPARHWNAPATGAELNKFAKHLLRAASESVATLPATHRNWPYAFEARQESREEIEARCMEPVPAPALG